MQTYWRDRGNAMEAQKYEAEGAEATKDLIIWGGLAGVGGIAKGLNSSYTTKGTALGEKVRKLTPNGKSNPTIFENGKPKFRIHKPGEHGAPQNESYIDYFQEGVIPIMCI
ncbi:hypothetical protein [uncultured Chryseobacterium sp.]